MLPRSPAVSDRGTCAHHYRCRACTRSHWPRGCGRQRCLVSTAGKAHFAGGGPYVVWTGAVSFWERGETDIFVCV